MTATDKTILHRLEAAISASGRTANAVLIEAGLAENCIRQARSAGTTPSVKVISGVCGVLGISADQIITGHQPAASFAPLFAIRPMGDNPRQDFDLEFLEELADSIEARGVLQPLVLRRLFPGEEVPEMPGLRFAVVAGENRWRALMMLAQRERWDGEAANVPYVLKHYDTPADALFDALTENRLRRDMPPLDAAEALAKLRRQKFSPAQIAKASGWKVRRIQQLIKLATDLIPEARTALRENVISYTFARELSETTPAIQAALLPRCHSFRTSDDLARTIRQMEEAKDPGEAYQRLAEKAAPPAKRAAKRDPEPLPPVRQMIADVAQQLELGDDADDDEEEGDTFDADEAAEPRTIDDLKRCGQVDMLQEVIDWIGPQIHGARQKARADKESAYWYAKAQAGENLIAVIRKYKKEAGHAPR
ncbi:ParB/RepB/Spo0J family partition protein [Ferrovibrio sp.]|uniref:ParB/RepB/Spo0J family partition protein n=1 Tax=Ferrovibrio sp. TaxID=1917215 RepID=UPI003D0B9DC4